MHKTVVKMIPKTAITWTKMVTNCGRIELTSFEGVNLHDSTQETGPRFPDNFDTENASAKDYFNLMFSPLMMGEGGFLGIRKIMQSGKWNEKMKMMLFGTMLPKLN